MFISVAVLPFPKRFEEWTRDANYFMGIIYYLLKTWLTYIFFLSVLYIVYIVVYIYLIIFTCLSTITAHTYPKSVFAIRCFETPSRAAPRTVVGVIFGVCHTFLSETSSILLTPGNSKVSVVVVCSRERRMV